MRPRGLLRRVGGTRKTEKTSKLSTRRLHEAVLRVIAASNERGCTGEALDIGSGKGELVRIIRERFGLKTSACDYTESLMLDKEQQVDVVDLNCDRLPYESERFALVTCIETIEHLEQTRPLLREIHRVLRRGGVAVISTPNILNLRSRLRYLFSGFFNLFGPLSVSDRDIHNPAGHINPVGYFYLAHALREVGFDSIRPFIDRYQRRSWIAYLLLWLPLKINGTWFRQREERKLRTINKENWPLIAPINSRDLLLGRTLIVCARKTT